MRIDSLATRVPRCRDDDGVTLVEIMVAFSLLLVLSAAVGAGLLAVQKSAMTSKERSAAANLATREIEVVRNWFHSSDTAPLDVMNTGDTVNGAPLPGQTGALVVDNVPYTVKRQVTWLVTGNGVSACDGGSIVTYPSIGVHVEVTWPNMGGVPPVVSDTVLTPPKSVLNSSNGYLAIKVVNRDGNANAGRTVTATGPAGTFSDTTGPDGCATFVLNRAGTYTVSLTEGSSGYVAYNGSTSQSVAVSIGSLVVRSFTYDLGVSIRATLTAPAGFSLPATLPVIALGNAGILPSGVSTFPTDASGTVVAGPLWPFSSGYSVWAGSCTDSDPGLTGTRPAALTPAKGTTASTTAALQAVAITTTYLGAPVDVPVTATYSGSGSCPAGDGTLTLGTSSAGVLNSSLPYGTWTLSANIGSGPVTAIVQLDASTGGVVTLDGA